MYPDDSRSCIKCREISSQSPDIRISFLFFRTHLLESVKCQTSSRCSAIMMSQCSLSFRAVDWILLPPINPIPTRLSPPFHVPSFIISVGTGMTLPMTGAMAVGTSLTTCLRAAHCWLPALQYGDRTHCARRSPHLKAAPQTLVALHAMIKKKPVEATIHIDREETKRS